MTTTDPPVRSFYGRMNAPTAAAVVRGPCGEEMEIHLHIREGVIEDIRFFTEGCAETRRCGEAVAAAAYGNTVTDALAISPRQIIDTQDSLPDTGRHCAILAVSTLFRAIGEYLFMP